MPSSSLSDDETEGDLEGTPKISLSLDEALSSSSLLSPLSASLGIGKPSDVLAPRKSDSNVSATTKSALRPNRFYRPKNPLVVCASSVLPQSQSHFEEVLAATTFKLRRDKKNATGACRDRPPKKTALQASKKSLKNSGKKSFVYERRARLVFKQDLKPNKQISKKI